MNLEEYLEDKRQVINDALSSLLPTELSPPRRLHKAMRYSLFAGGKRLRPILVLAAAEAVGGKWQQAVNTACALECIHTYSLIHDDLPAMDDDDLRRGKPTCHKAYGEATAVLAGDALLTAAFAMVADSGVDGASIKAVIKEITRGAGTYGMIGGQMIDMECEGKEPDFAEVENMHIKKTGALILASVRSGAILGGASDKELSALSAYGEAAGLAFQIADDLLDVEGTTEELGKRAGADQSRGKATYPALLGVSESRERAEELTKRAVSALEPLDEKADPLREIARYIVKRKG